MFIIKIVFTIKKILNNKNVAQTEIKKFENQPISVAFNFPVSKFSLNKNTNLPQSGMYC